MPVYRKVDSPESGFTLVEIIASIVLLGVIISIFLSVFPQMINWSNAAEKELVASNLSAKVAHEIGDIEEIIGKKPDLEKVFLEYYKNPKIVCTENDYIPVKFIEAEKSYDTKEENINEVDYIISMKACMTSQEKDLNLMRVHFTIMNSKTNHKIDSYAFYKGGS